jgi:hypothetical protein
MAHRPTFVDRSLDAGAELLARAISFEESGVDELDIDPAVLSWLDRVRDLHEFSRGGVGISDGGWARRTSRSFHMGDMDVLAHALNVDHCAAEATGLAAC